MHDDILAIYIYLSYIINQQPCPTRNLKKRKIVVGASLTSKVSSIKKRNVWFLDVAPRHVIMLATTIIMGPENPIIPLKMVIVFVF